MEFDMSFVIPGKVDRNILNTVESSLTAATLDDLLETSLSHLLDVDHVKAAEIQLFNRQKKWTLHVSTIVTF
jgi:hypothetical protein